MIITDYFPDDLRAFDERLGRGPAAFFHGVEDAAVAGLEAVTRVGQGAANDEALAEVERSLPILRNHPVRIIWGGQDFCFNYHYYNRWRVLLPGANADYLESAGHYVLEDAGQYCQEEIRLFLGLNF